MAGDQRMGGRFRTYWIIRKVYTVGLYSLIWADISPLQEVKLLNISVDSLREGGLRVLTLSENEKDATAQCCFDRQQINSVSKLICQNIKTTLFCRRSLMFGNHCVSNSKLQKVRCQ